MGDGFRSRGPWLDSPWAQRGQTQVDLFTALPLTPSSCLTCIQGLTPTMNGMGSPGLITLTCGERSQTQAGCLATVRGGLHFHTPQLDLGLFHQCPQDTSALVCQELIPHFHSYSLPSEKGLPPELQGHLS